MADSNLAITVAIATLDRPEGLARGLDALEGGAVLPAEILVVDQSAGDETARLITRRGQSHFPVRYLRQARLGLSASRNAGLRAASSPLVAMTDDDCVPGEGWVAALVDGFSDEGVAGVSGRVLPYGPEAPGLYAVSSRVSAERARFTGKLPPWHAGSGGNFAVRKDVWRRLGGFDERLGAGSLGRAAEDMDFIYRMLAAGCSILYEPAAVIYHERQELHRRIASRWTYGYGIGAACGKWLRGGDLYAFRLLAGWTVWRGRDLLRAVRQGRAQARGESRLMLQGTAAGFVYGLGLRSRDFAPQARPVEVAGRP